MGEFYERCWTSGRLPTKQGYDRTKVDGRNVYAHRHVYEVLVGPIPEGLELDHLCRNRACYNPTHLEPVSHATNVRRGLALATGKQRPPQGWATRTTCMRGHVFDHRTGRQRVCLACQRLRHRLRTGD